MRPLKEISLWTPPMRFSTEDFYDILSLPPGAQTLREALGLPRDLKAEVAGSAKGDLGASSQPTLPTHWEPAGSEGLGTCTMPLVMGKHLLQSPSSPEPQAIGLRLPHKQSQTKPMRHRAMLGAMAMPRAIFTKHTATSRHKLRLAHTATLMESSDRTGAHTRLARYSYT